jgi:hypothetical protein
VTCNRQNRYWRSKVKIDLTLRARTLSLRRRAKCLRHSAFHHFAAALAQGIAEV